MSDADRLRDEGVIFCMRPSCMLVPAVPRSLERHCSTCKRVVLISPASARAIESGRIRDILKCCCCAGVHTANEAVLKFPDFHGHQWRGRDLRCECGMTWAEFHGEVGEL